MGVERGSAIATSSKDYSKASKARDEQLHASGNGPLVSVVIPCYNQAHFLGEAIESVLEQTYERHEIVVIDDGSTDDTSEVASHYDGVHLIRQENRGLSRARNTGIEHSEGEYLVFLDADDRLLPEALRTGVEVLDSHLECVFVFGHYRFIARNGSPLAECRPSIHGDYYESLLRRNFIGMHATVVYRRGLFESVGAFDGALNACEDYDLYLRVARRFPIYNHSTLVAEYRRYDGAMSRNPGRMLKTATEVLRSQWPYAKNSEHYREAYKTGIRSSRTVYGIPLAKEVREQAREGNWKRVVSGAWTLLRYYPGGLLLVPKEKYWIARELADRERRLRQRNLRIRELKDACKEQQAEIRRLKKQRRVLGEKRRQLRGATERNRHLARRNQMLERRIQEIEEAWSWKLAQRMMRTRTAMVAKVFHKGQPGPDPPGTGSERISSPPPITHQHPQNESVSRSAEHGVPVGKVDLGSLGRVKPISQKFGFDRGQPIDRYYIENFLADHAGDIRGRVLEIGDDSYTRQFGGKRVTVSDVLHVSDGNPQATIVGDLTRADHIPTEAFDCIIFTQTLQFIYDVSSAIQTLHRILKPGGVLLATFPGISQIAHDRWGDQQYWAFTHLSAWRLFEHVFSASNVTVETHGNVLVAISFLHGLAVEELRKGELDERDPAYEVVITLRAVKHETSP